MNASDIPVDQLSIQYSRAGGPGGQHVNKVETKVEIRFVLGEADWLDDKVKERLRSLTKVTKADEVLVSSGKFRSRQRNLDDCLEKLAALLTQAGQVPKARKATRPSRRSQARRMDEKRKQGEKKKSRQWKPDH